MEAAIDVSQNSLCYLKDDPKPCPMVVKQYEHHAGEYYSCECPCGNFDFDKHYVFSGAIHLLYNREFGFTCHGREDDKGDHEGEEGEEHEGEGGEQQDGGDHFDEKDFDEGPRIDVDLEFKANGDEKCIIFDEDQDEPKVWDLDRVTLECQDPSGEEFPLYLTELRKRPLMIAEGKEVVFNNVN